MARAELLLQCCCSILLACSCATSADEQAPTELSSTSAVCSSEEGGSAGLGYASLVQLRTQQSKKRVGGAPLSALIVEPRCHPALPLVVANLHTSFPEVPVQVVYGEANQEYVKERLAALLARFFAGEQERRPVSSWLLAVPLPAESFRVGLPSTRKYSDLLRTPAFWDMTTGKKVLVFQTDSWLCRNAEQKLRKFLSYDFVGAPWHPAFVLPKMGKCRVGNGGLSLRTREVMRNASANFHQSIEGLSEDIFFCKALRTGMGTLPSKQKAAEFAYETMTTHSHDPVGVHKVWRYQRKSVVHQLSRNCPGLLLLNQSRFLQSSCSGTGDADLLGKYRELLDVGAGGV